MANPTKSGFYIPSLDGIRAMAFAIVFVSHAGLGSVIPGGFGVTTFFFLSGYLITTLMRKEFAQTGTIRLRQFYLRRVIRIFPPFYLTLILLSMATLVGLLPGKLAPGAMAAQTFFFSNYYAIGSATTPLWPVGTEIFWSLAVEEHFYLLFPILAIPLIGRTRPRAQAVILGFACLAFLAWRCYLVYHLQYNEERTYTASDTRMDSMLFGCILALGSNPAIDPAMRLRGWTKFAVYVASIGLLVFCWIDRDPGFRETFRYTLQGLALMPLFYFAVAEPDQFWFRWLNWRWVRFFGLLSYSLYLVHFSTLKMVAYLFPDLGRLLQAIVTLVLSVGYALLLYHAVERPLARLRKRLHSDPRPPSALPPSEDDRDDSGKRLSAMPES